MINMLLIQRLHFYIFLRKHEVFFSFHLALTKINGPFVPIMLTHKQVVLLFKIDYYFSQLKCNNVY